MIVICIGRLYGQYISVVKYLKFIKTCMRYFKVVDGILDDEMEISFHRPPSW